MCEFLLSSLRAVNRFSKLQEKLTFDKSVDESKLHIFDLLSTIVKNEVIFILIYNNKLWLILAKQSLNKQVLLVMIGLSVCYMMCFVCWLIVATA